ncbi:MAG: hypothetical protein K8L99_26845 [Anaerolineae bacterium]|nr:hypothetical protein [Anaerolineae bacterium]
MDLSNFILQAHSGWRWIVILATVVALAWMLVGLLQQRTYDQMARRIMLIFTISIDIQFLLGIILLLLRISQTGLQSVYIEHTVIMLIALVVAHLTSRWKSAADNLRYRNNLIAIIVVLVLVYVGVARVGGWA